MNRQGYWLIFHKGNTFFILPYAVYYGKSNNTNDLT